MAHLVQIQIPDLELIGIGGQDHADAGHLLTGLAKAHLDAVLPGKVQLGLHMLARAGVLGLADYQDLILRQLLSQAEGGGQRGISGGAALQALQVCQQLGDAHNFALRHGDIAIHVAQGTGGRTGHVGAIRPVGKRDAEAGVAGGTGLPVELGVRGHVQAGQIN